MVKALLLEDDCSARSSLSEFVANAGYAVESAGTIAEARQRLKGGPPDLALLDVSLRDGDGFEILHELPVPERTDAIVMAGTASVDSAVAALRSGARDYLTKPVDLDRLRRILDDVSQLRHRMFGKPQMGDELPTLLGTSHALQRVRELVRRAAGVDATVLISGESGTGKELVARSLHDSGPRRTGPFVALNCGAIAPGLVESELFGHERGSFTGAIRQKRGVFERARHGTLFLDEVTEMPLEAQVKLLRALETGSIERVGGEETIAVDTRVIAATNRDPSTAVAEGMFRADLLYRLDVFPIHLAPLRERGDDIEILARHFLGQLNGEVGSRKSFSADAVRRLRRHPWPGNVRELRNVVQRAFLLSGESLDDEVLPREPERCANTTVVTIPLGSSMAAADRALLLATLDHVGGDKRRAARTLGISLKTLYNRLHVYAAGGGQSS